MQKLTLEDIRGRVMEGSVLQDRTEVLRWEGRIDELVAGQDQRTVFEILQTFGHACRDAKKFDKAGVLFVRCAEVCGAAERFNQQVLTLTNAGKSFIAGGDYKKAAVWLELARDVSKEQGFESLESDLCSRLGQVLVCAGRCDEGVEQHRRAWALAQSVTEEDDASHDRARLQRASLRFLVEALCQHGELEEADVLFNRLRERWDINADCRLWNHYLRGMVLTSESFGRDSSSSDFPAAAEAFQAAADIAEKHPEVLQDPFARTVLRKAKDFLDRMRATGDSPSLSSIIQMLEESSESRDWAGVLRWESRLEELLTTGHLTDFHQVKLIHYFASANVEQLHFAKAASLFQRSVELLGKLERFSEQGTDMCHVGDCFLQLGDAKGGEMWLQKARKLGETLGCYAVECNACYGLGRMELHLHRRLQEAEELFRHALAVVEFVEDERETIWLERDIKLGLVTVLLRTDRYEEAGPLSQRLCELAKRSDANPFHMVEALQLVVRLQMRRGDVEQATKDVQVLPSDPISHPPARDFRSKDPTSQLRHKPQPTVADPTLVVCACSSATRAE